MQKHSKKPNHFWLKNKQMLYTTLATINLLLGLNYGVVAQNVSYNVNSVPIGGNRSSAFGFEALKSNTGWSNTASGYQALYSNTTGEYNTANGYQALYSNTTGRENTANGCFALYYNTMGAFNTANGLQSLCHNTTGGYNTANGYHALYSNTTGWVNTANGFQALYSNTTGEYNTANGSNALYYNTTGGYNTASGRSALISNTTGSNNTALGYYADVTKGDLTNATAIGAKAKVSESNAIQLGDNAVTKVYAGVGKTATIITGGLQVTGGSPAVGQVLTSDASGIATWQAPNTGRDWHLFGNYDASETSFIGPQNLVSFNIKIQDNIAGKLDPTYFNTFYGYLAGQKTQPYYSNGTNNTAVGYSSLATNTYGTQNTTLGYKADVGTENLTNATALGANAKVSESNAIQLGDNAVTKVYAGVGKTATVITGGLQVTGGTPAVGKVLTSDASGTATWQTPSNDWTLRGNAGTTDSNFIGTTDDKPLNIRINNQKAGRIDSASQNTFYGYKSGNANTSGSNNTVVGYKALSANTTGQSNTAIGSGADVSTSNLTNATVIGANAKVTTSNAVQLGDNAVTKVYAGVGNTATVIAGGLQITGGTPAIGKVLTSDASGTASWQTPIPSWSLTGNTGTVDGVNFVGTIDNIPFNIRVNNQKAARIDHLKFNTFYGYQSGNANTTGGNNTVVGHKALSINTAGLNNTAVGFEALLSNATGAGNTALGQSADVGAGNLTNATALGAKAKVTESNAIQLGDNAVTKVYAGVGKTATVITGGLQVTGGTPAAGKVLTSDANGIASWQTPTVGWGLTGNAGTVDGTNFMGTTDNVPLTLKVNNQKAGRIDHTLFNTSYGYQSANSTTTGSANTVTGYQALYANTTGWYNTANGYTALYYTTGNHNTGSGYRALKNNAEGSGNTAMGSDALLTNNTGWYNTASGYQALYTNTTGSNNTASGVNALYKNIDGSNNTANGRAALYNNTTGQGNTASGESALYNSTTGSFNTASGVNALVNNVTGNNNTALGFAADVATGNLTNATAIGAGASVNASNKIRLGDAAVTVIEGTVTYTTSDARFKTNVTEQDVKGLAFIKKLRPVVYNFDTKKFQQFLIHNMPADAQKAYLNKDFSASTAIRQSGFIAQEVEKAAEEVGYDFNGLHKPENQNDNYSLAYSQFVVPLVKGMQEQQQVIEQLQKEKEQQQKVNEQQQKTNEQQKKTNEQLQQRLEALEKIIASNNNSVITKDELTKPITGNEVQVYPNPNNGVFNVVVPAGAQKMELIDMKGALLKTIHVDSKTASHQLNLSGYAKGMYILQVVVNGKIQTSKVVVQ